MRALLEAGVWYTMPLRLCCFRIVPGIRVIFIRRQRQGLVIFFIYLCRRVDGRLYIDVRVLYHHPPLFPLQRAHFCRKLADVIAAQGGAGGGWQRIGRV
jgi:hypothetical protein